MYRMDSILHFTGGMMMVKDSKANKKDRHNKPKLPDEQRRGKGKSNTRNTNN